MAVVLHHAEMSVSAFVDKPPPPVRQALEFGYLGVDFFFVLSGFIIHYTMQVSPRPARRFARDRLQRIMLPYLPIGLGLALAYTLLPKLSDSGRNWGWISTLTLLPTAHPPALSVAWTLQHELVFYFVYAGLFFSRWIRPGLAAWAVLIAGSQLFWAPDWPLARVFMAAINVEFIAGVAAAELFLSGRRLPKLGMAAAAGLVAAFVMTGAHRADSWLVGFAIAALLPGICSAERGGAFSVPRWAIFGGAASYAIYLTHNPLLSIAARGMAALHLGWVSALVLSTVVCAAVGVAYYLLYERPVMRFAGGGRRTHAGEVAAQIGIERVPH